MVPALQSQKRRNSDSLTQYQKHTNTGRTRQISKAQSQFTGGKDAEEARRTRELDVVAVN